MVGLCELWFVNDGLNANMVKMFLVPPDKCLLGCIFLIVEYDKHPEHCNNVAKWRAIIEENGGEVEPSYCLKLTHILCQTQKHPLVQQVHWLRKERGLGILLNLLNE